MPINQIVETLVNKLISGRFNTIEDLPSAALVNTASTAILSGATANATVIIPAGMGILGVYVKNNTANAVTGGIRVGTTAGADNVVDMLGVGPSTECFVTEGPIRKRFFSFTAPQTLHVQAITSWNSANVDLRFILYPVG